MLRGLRTSSRQTPSPQPFVLYAVLVAGVGLALVAFVPWTREWRVGSPPVFLVLSAFLLAGELLPLPVPRRRRLARVALSTAFAFPILLRCGPRPPALVSLT